MRFLLNEENAMVDDIASEKFRLFQQRVNDANIPLTGRKSMIMFAKLRGYNADDIINAVSNEHQQLTQQDIDNVNTNMLGDMDLTGISKEADSESGESGDDKDKHSQFLNNVSAKKLRAYTDKLSDMELHQLINHIKERIGIIDDDGDNTN